MQEKNTPLFRHHVASQIAAAVQPRSAAGGETDTAERACGALAAWAGLTENGDAIESMIAAQMVATHDLSMMAITQAVRRAAETGHFGGYINDACKVARVNMHQIETLARYRTWRLREAKASVSHDSLEHDPLEQEPHIHEPFDSGAFESGAEE